MSKVQPVFFLSNTDRKDDFLIETRIWNKNGALVVEKRAVTEAAKKHLDHMINTHRVLSGVTDLSKLLNIVAPGKSQNQSVNFNYIKGVSAERMLLEKVLLKDEKGSCAIIDKLFSMIDCLPSIKINPANNSRYNKVFGKSFNKTLDCTELGIIDLNLDNIIVGDDGVWHLYDYEWTFDFPVPKQLMRLRFLWYFIYRHREVLRYHAQRIDSVLVNKNLYFPHFLYDRYKEIFKDFDDLRVAEAGFQQYVTGNKNYKLSAGWNVDPDLALASPSFVGIEATLNQTVLKAHDQLVTNLQLERQKRVNVENELSEITSSKGYRLAKKFALMKRKILPK